PEGSLWFLIEAATTGVGAWSVEVRNISDGSWTSVRTVEFGAALPSAVEIGPVTAAGRVAANGDLSMRLRPLSGSGALAIDLVQAVRWPHRRGDFDRDGAVNGADLARLIGDWGLTGTATDVDGDGIVTAADLSALLGSWGSCAQP
ncbi:MAG: dockerin type I domain-containing protein, partial [Planctomycetota bacterium]